MIGTINETKVGYTDQGSGVPLLFVHAFPLSKAMWQPQVEDLAGAYRVITIDLRGHGESETILWNFSLEDYASDIIGLLDHLEISEAVFIGLSMGGYTLFSLYRTYPARVKALVFADTRAQADNRDGKVGRRAMAQVAFKKGPFTIADLMLPKLLAPSTVQQQLEIVEQVRSMILQTKPEGIITDLMAMAARQDSTDLLGKISCPTLIVVGEEDQATPPAESQYIADRVAGSTLVTIPAAGHLSNFEQPASFNRAIRSFLKAHGF